MISISDIFIQPSNYCDNNNCKHCYVKARNYNQQISVEIFRDLLQTLVSYKPICTQNITISIDGYSCRAEQYSKEICNIINLQDRPSLHTTTNTFDCLVNHLQGVNNIVNLDTTSYSDIKNNIEIIKSFKKVYNKPVIYNLLVHPMGVFGLDFNLDKFKQIVDTVDIIYVIFTKYSMGKSLTKDQIWEYRQRVKNYFKYWNKINKVVPSNKYIMDRCITESINNLSTGYTCSANSSLLQVWPDGSVSGCPYAYQSTGNRFVKQVDDIIQNLHLAKKKCEFYDCLLAKLVQEYYIKEHRNG